MKFALKLLIFLVTGLCSTIHAQGMFGSGMGGMSFAPDEDDDISCWYISPGVQIGWAMGTGLFYSGQITIGKVSLRRGAVYIFPGATFGYRRYRRLRFGYADLQANIKPIRNGQVAGSSQGLGVGTFWHVKQRNPSNPLPVRKLRLKAWCGYFGLTTYDVFWRQDGEAIHNAGVMGVLPLPIFE